VSDGQPVKDWENAFAWKLVRELVDSLKSFEASRIYKDMADLIAKAEAALGGK
jgi:hypothetical protein